MGACSSLGKRTITLDNGYKVKIQTQIAEGGYSYIYRVREKKGKSLCLKRIPAGDTDQFNNAQTELKMFKLLIGKAGFLPLLASKTHTPKSKKKNKNKTDAKTANSNNNKNNNNNECSVLLLFPLMKHSLFTLIVDLKHQTTHPIQDQNEAVRIIKSVAEAVGVLHSLGYIHGDLKPQNILLDEKNKPLLCDLASCRPLERTPMNRSEAIEIQDDAERYCTASYRPPELHDVKTRETLDGKVDVFGLGCSLYFILVGKNPFDGPDGALVKLGLMAGTFSYPEECKGRLDKAVRNLIKGMLKADPKKRVSVKATVAKCEKILGNKT